jgi:plasmid stabilization system protein ParE
MARQLVWSAQAEADVAEIGWYLERAASQAVAAMVIAEIRSTALGVADFPFSCRMIPEFQDPARRETFAYAYRIMYRVAPTEISILRVVHGRRLLRNVPGSFEEAPEEFVCA